MRIVFDPEASADLDQIFAWIAKDNPVAAHEVILLAFLALIVFGCISGAVWAVKTGHPLVGLFFVILLPCALWAFVRKL